MQFAYHMKQKRTYVAFMHISPLNLLSPKNDRGQIDRIEKAIQSLEHFPMRHRLIDLEPWQRRCLRFMACDSFLIFYFVREEKREVVVSRVLYGKRDIEKAMNDD